MKISTHQYVQEQIQYLKQLQEADRRYYDAEITAIRRAVDKYSQTNDDKWVGANEFRGQLKDQAGTFLTRRELWLAVLAVIGVVISIVTLLINKQHA